MDKYEYKQKTEQMLELMEDGAFSKAAEIADSVDWKRVRNAKMLTDVSDIYEKNGDYQKSYDVLNIAYHRAEGSRKIIYQLCTLALKTKNVDEAIDYYDDFQQIAPKDPNKFILRYQILRAQRAPIDQQIEALETFKKAEYIEEWAYELAKLYQEAGQTAKCLEECDDLILWFNEGKYVYQAMELKMKYKPLTPSQQEKYDRRYEGMSNETVEMPNVVEYQKEKEASVQGEQIEDVPEEVQEDARASSERIIPESKMVDAKGRKIGNTMKLDEALKSLLHLGMGDEDKVKDSSTEPVSTDVTFDEDKLKDAIEEIEAVVDLNLVDELSTQKGLRELKVDPDLEELRPEPEPEELEESSAPGKTRLDAATTIMEPIRLELREEKAAEVKQAEPELNAEKTLEELYAEAGEPIGGQPVPDEELMQEPYENEEEVFGEQYEESGELLEEPYTEAEQLMRELDEEARETIAELDEEERGTTAQLDEEAKRVIEELDEEVGKTTGELDEEEGNTANRPAAKTSRVSAEENKDQIEGQMSLLDIMTGMDIQEGSASVDDSEVFQEENEEVREAQTEEDIPAGRTQGTKPILPPDIQRMIDEIEGVVPEEDLQESKKTEIEKTEPEQEVKPENMGDVADKLRVDESSEWFEDYDDVLDDAEYEEELPIQIENELEVEEYTEEIEISLGGDIEGEGIEEKEDAINFGGIEDEEDGLAIEYQDEDEEDEDEYIERLSRDVSAYEVEYDETESGMVREEAENAHMAVYEDADDIEEAEEYTEEYEESSYVREVNESGSEEPEDAEEYESGELDDSEEYESEELGDAEGYESEGFKDVEEYGSEDLDDIEEYESEELVDAEEYEGEELVDAEAYESEEPDDIEEYSEEETVYTEEEEEFDDSDGYEEYEEEYSEEYEYEEEKYYEEDTDEYAYEEEYEYDAASVEANLEDEFSPSGDYDEEYDERLMHEEEEEVDILSKTTPLSRKETAKLIATGKTSPLPMDEISDALSLSNTGFVVHGRYDLKMQSGIGTRAGLTEEQKKLFSYFVPVRGMSEQLVDVLEQDKNCTNRRGTSNTGNLLIIGNKGNGKTVLAVDVVKAIQKQRNIRQGKVAIVTGDSLNKKKISDIFSKLYGGALIIEKAGKMNEKTVARVNKAMERDTGELLIVLEDQRKPLDRLLTSNREFRRKFTSRLEVPILINDELVTFGQTYAQENGYQIDEMGILALYSRIDMLQREDHAVTIAEVKEVMDEAMEHSQKASAKKLVKRVLGKNRDDSDRIILTEKDFN